MKTTFEARAVGIVFQGRSTLPATPSLRRLKSTMRYGLLVAAAAEAHGDAAGVVAAAFLGLADRQGLDGLALVKIAAIDERELAKARRGRIVCLPKPWSLVLRGRWSRRCDSRPQA